MKAEWYQKRYRPQPGKIRVVIDTDAGNSVDDQYAIAWLLKSPERLNVEAVYAEPYSYQIYSDLDAKGIARDYINEITKGGGTPAEGMEEGYQEVLKIGELCGVDLRSKTFRGATHFCVGENVPVDSEAARDLVKRAKSGPPIYVVAIGAITNIASAIMMDPSIMDNLIIVWLGGEPLYFPQTFEFNLSEDLIASKYIFDCGVPLVYIPTMTVASHITITKEELDVRLKGRNVLCDYLYKIVEELLPHDAEIADKMMRYNQTGNLRGIYDMEEGLEREFVTRHYVPARIIWDLAAAAYVINPMWCPVFEVPSPVLLDDSRWGKENLNRHPIKVCSFVFRECILGDLYHKLVQES